MVQTGDFICTNCRRHFTRDEMHTIVEKEVQDETVGTLFIKKGVCFRCAGVPRPTAEDEKPKNVRNDGGKKR